MHAGFAEVWTGPSPKVLTPRNICPLWMELLLVQQRSRSAIWIMGLFSRTTTRHPACIALSGQFDPKADAPRESCDVTIETAGGRLAAIERIRSLDSCRCAQEQDDPRSWVGSIKGIQSGLACVRTEFRNERIVRSVITVRA